MSDLFGAPIPEEPTQTDEPTEEISYADSSVQSSGVSTFGNMGLLPEYANPELKGLDAQQHLLLDMWKSGKFPHALALTGPKGIGKATLAFHLARYILEHSGDDQTQAMGLFGEEDAPAKTLSIPETSHNYTQVVSGGHPDVLAVGDFYKGEDETDANFAPLIEDIRKVPSFLRKTSAYGGWRVVIVDNADHMNLNAQNAILKILEEPPSRALLILVVHKEGAMLPTIKSRIRTLKCPSLPEAIVRELLVMDSPELDSDDLDLLTLMANGSAAKAIHFAREGGADTLKEAIAFFSNLKDLKNSEVLSFCEIMSAKNNAAKLAQWREILVWFIELVIYGKARGQDPFKGLDMSNQLGLQMTVQNFVAQGSVQDWLNVLEQLKDHFYQCDRQHLDAYYEVHNALNICRPILMS